MRLTNREHGYLDRLRERCDVLRARINEGSFQQNYIMDWDRERKALLWAITKIEDTAQGASELQSAAASKKEPTE